MKQVKWTLIILTFCLMATQIAFSATYSLKWTGNGRTTINGANFCSGKCKPGDIILLPPGTSNDGLYIHQLYGDVNNPIVIKNTPGKITKIDTKFSSVSPVFGNGIFIQSSKYVKIDGSNGFNESNEDSLTYGIRITNCAYKGIFLNKGTSEVELQYLEIDNIGNRGFNNQGIGIKEDSKIGQANVPQGTILGGLNVHHNYIHHTTTEGMYLGASGSCWDSSSECCNSLNDSDDAVIWRNTKIYKNKVDSTGWDGISVSCCESSSVFGNIITNTGLGRLSKLGQGAGISLNKGFGGSAFDNKIYGIQKEGILWHGSAQTNIFNNIIVDVGQQSTAKSYERIAISDNGNDEAYLTIKYNTIINPKFEAIRLQPNQKGLIQDNLYVNIGVSNKYGKAFAQYPGILKKSIFECYFYDSLRKDYRLTISTPKDIKFGGQDSGFPTFDIINVQRHPGYVAVGAHTVPLSEYGITGTNSFEAPQQLTAILP